VWVNKVGTYGVASAGFSWSRFAAAVIIRLSHYLLSRRWGYEALLFADDLMMLAERAAEIDDLTLSIKPGESVAIVGPSGSGKSTLLRLLLGFETPTNGVVLYDGRDMRNLDVLAVRRQLGVVLQDSALDSGQIRKNVSGPRRMRDSEIWEVLEAAAVADDIRAMPMRLETPLTFGGGGISGGQRQRLLIARALATQPRILVLDEATSALDNRAQATISANLDAMGITRIIVAHRLSTIRNADRIIVLDGGRIAQEGSFDELVNDESGLFHRFAQRQLI
jgi:ATP-binding cassette subfamily C protein